jgi:hypothetical protein
LTRDTQINSEANIHAAPIVAGPDPREAANTDPGVEAAWVEWSSRLKQADDRALFLLRAAFEAGYHAGSDAP